MKNLWIWHVKNFFGFFAPTQFESRLLDFLCENSDADRRNVLRQQISCFNFVNRILDSDDSRLAYGLSDFYYKRGASVLRPPTLLRGLEDVDEFILMECLAEDVDGTKIKCSFIAVKGVLFEIQYRSDVRRWHPIGMFNLTVI